MLIKKTLYMIAGLLIYIGFNMSVAAERVDTQLSLSMEVVNITCLINDGAGINQQVHLPLVSEADLRKGTAKGGLAKIIVDCSNNSDIPVGIRVSLTPARGASVVGSGVDGILRTDLSGVALKLVWQINDQPASLAVGDYSTFSPSASDPLRWNISLLVTPQYIQGDEIGKGFYNSAVKVYVTYL